MERKEDNIHSSSLYDVKISSHWICIYFYFNWYIFVIFLLHKLYYASNGIILHEKGELKAQSGSLE